MSVELSHARLAILGTDDMYVRCPRCKGSRMLWAYTTPPTEFTRGQGEHFTCPVCAGTGEVDRDDALRWIDEATDDGER